MGTQRHISQNVLFSSFDMKSRHKQYNIVENKLSDIFIYSRYRGGANVSIQLSLKTESPTSELLYSNTSIQTETVVSAIARIPISLDNTRLCFSKGKGSLELEKEAGITNSPLYFGEKSSDIDNELTHNTLLSSLRTEDISTNLVYGTPDIGKELKKDPVKILDDIRNKNINKDKIIIGHLNVNHIGNKFEPLASIVKDRVHVLLLSETKLDGSFPNGQFLIEGYTTPFKKDRNIFGGGLCCGMLKMISHVRELNYPPLMISNVYLLK